MIQKNFMIKDYIERLSSKEPIPGGGSAAALAGALSSALTAMVFNLTIGKKIYDEYTEDERALVNESLTKIEEYNNELLNFMDEDGEAFLSLMSAFKLPKNTEKEKMKRIERINIGYKTALQVPLNLAERCMEVYEHVLIASKYGNKNVISDAGVAAILLQSAVESAILNVNINLSGIKDENYKNKIEDECGKIMKEALSKKDEIMKIVNSKIS
ncbi:cyclodeaminase/cyclohydrolase family protein [Clostridium ganghwense]|uniref:Cyclodeaminase/cyclohydrolase family protein n=1 Tax=Clostridium ganghwense TaxID=312089 RepID=A0ABT4CN53_9CLOT|nr:cyclodeaminase/cyclohydrolase family protein [Clostridium ganghwense]MCY6370490.1 cyclodeaminase/cyclohydrolase family protein [Clostridium ganghwense]